MIEKIKSLFFEYKIEIDFPQDLENGTYFIQIENFLILQFKSPNFYGLSFLNKDIFYGEGCDESFSDENEFLARLKDLKNENCF